MRKIVGFLMAFLLVSSLAFAFLLQVEILTPEEIAKLSDKKLVDVYVDISVEIEAAKSFYSTSGFIPKDYERFKEVLRYRVYLIQEMEKRKIEVPRVE